MKRRLVSVGRWLLDHPLHVVAVLAGISAVLSALGIGNGRVLGTYDTDESGYLANALRFQRAIDPVNPLEVVREVFRTTTAPLLPMLSVPFLIVGSRDPRTAMMVLPVLQWGICMSGAWLVRRSGPPALAILIGGSLAALPTLTSASITYWFGLGAAMAFIGGCAALVASDGLSNRWRWVYGLCIGLAPLTRTMMIGLVPAMVLAGLWVAWGDRRRLRALGGPLLLAGAVALPWLLVRWEDVFGYLFDYGYGAKAEQWGPGGSLDRITLRLKWTVGEFGMLFSGPFLLLPPVVVAFAWYRGRVHADQYQERPVREFEALVIAWVIGFVVLLSSRNRGVWFELPLVVLGLSLVGMAVPAAPKVLRAIVCFWLVLTMSVAVITADRSLDPRPFSGNAGEYDRRLASGTSGTAEQAQAIGDWQVSNTKVTAALAELTDRGRSGSVTMTGNMYLLNSNSLALEAELDGWYLRSEVPDTTLPDADLDAWLTPASSERTPDGTRKERVLAIVDDDREVFTPDQQWPRFEELARVEGWVEVFNTPLPGGGRVKILRHPANGGGT